MFDRVITMVFVLLVVVSVGAMFYNILTSLPEVTKGIQIVIEDGGWL